MFMVSHSYMFFYKTYPIFVQVLFNSLYHNEIKKNYLVLKYFMVPQKNIKAWYIDISYPMLNNQRCHSFWYIIQTQCRSVSIISRNLPCNLLVLYLKFLDLFSFYDVLIYYKTSLHQQLYGVHNTTQFRLLKRMPAIPQVSLSI